MGIFISMNKLGLARMGWEWWGKRWEWWEKDENDGKKSNDKERKQVRNYSYKILQNKMFIHSSEKRQKFLKKK